MLISRQSQWSESLIGVAEVLLVDRWEFLKTMRPVDLAGIGSAMLLSITRRGLKIGYWEPWFGRGGPIGDSG